MWLPKPLYELKPFLYGGVGLVHAIDFSNTLAFLSGGLMVIATLLIFKERYQYRTYY